MHTFPQQKLLRSEDILLLDMSRHQHQLSAVPHKHDHYTLMWIQQEASSTQSIDGNTYEMRSGRIFFMAPGQIHVMDSKRQQGWLLLFSEVLFQYFLNTHPGKETIGITTPLPPGLSSICHGRKGICFRLYSSIFIIASKSGK